MSEYKASISLRKRAPRPISTSVKTTRRTAKKRVVPGEEALDRLIAQAEYEVEKDPYRGIASLGLGDENKDDPSPWRCCEIQSCDNSFSDTDHDGHDDYGSKLVSTVCHSACPSLKAWANEAHDKKRRSRKSKKQKTLSECTFPRSTGRRQCSLCM